MLLDEHGADVRARTGHGSTPLGFYLKFARLRQQGACTQALLAAGADVHAADSLGRTAIMKAALYGDRCDCIRALLAAGADVHAADAEGFTPMLSACRRGCMDTVRLLASHGATPHAVSADGTTALMLACSVRNGECVQWLLSNGVDLDTRDARGRTALMGSVQEFVPMLIAAGADLDLVDEEGSTALMICCQHGFISKVHTLLAAGADTWATGEFGCALEIAREEGHWACVAAVALARV
jgi:ankyrin repeat protein